MTRKVSAEKPLEPVEEPKAVITKPRDKRVTKPIAARQLTDEDRRPEVPVIRKQRKDRRRKSKRDNAVQWDQQSLARRRKEESSTPWIVGGSLLGLFVAGVGAWVVMDSHDKEKKTDSAPTSQLPSLTISDLQEDAKVELTEEEKKRQKEIRESVKTGMNVLTDAEKVVRKFMNAESLDEMAKHVRTPELTVERMRAWYGDDDWKPIGVKQVGVGSRVTVKGAMASMAVQLLDYSYRQVAMERVGGEYKVDWESWVVWSSMSWKQLFEKKPEQPVELRVSCSLDTYFNRHFRDDQKWISVKLVHPFEDRNLYGYIDKGSPSLTRLIGDLQGGKISAATIKVKFPKDSVANNQVEIIEYVQNGWVRPTAEEAEEE